MIYVSSRRVSTSSLKLKESGAVEAEERGVRMRDPINVQGIKQQLDELLPIDRFMNIMT